MRTTVTEQPATTPSGGDWEASRRDKLRRIVEMGRDPWGSRFDEHASIAALRERSNEIVLRLQDGQKVALPDLATAGTDFDTRECERVARLLFEQRMMVQGRSFATDPKLLGPKPPADIFSAANYDYVYFGPPPAAKALGPNTTPDILPDRPAFQTK